MSLGKNGIEIFIVFKDIGVFFNSEQLFGKRGGGLNIALNEIFQKMFQ